MKCTELVIGDHLILRRGLNILDGMVRKLEDRQRIEIMDVTAILKFFRVFGDEYLQTMEETVLFPALRLPQMVSEHSEERALVTGIEDALRSTRPGAGVCTSAIRLKEIFWINFAIEYVVARL